MFRAFAVLIAALTLSGCVTARTGAEYAVIMQKVGPPPAGHSRIVLLSEKSSGGYADFTIDGVATKTLKPGTYVYADRRAGKHQILGTQSMFPGETKQEITTAPGRTVFVMVRTSYRAGVVRNTGYSAGLAGSLLATVMTAGVDNPGPVDLLPIDEAAARTALAELQLAE